MPKKRVVPLDIPDECRLYRPYGAALSLMYAKDTELLMSGSAGTGKTRAALEKLHLVMQKYPKARGLLCRKERASLSETTLVTFENKVVQAGFFSDGGKRSHRQTYDYPNGSQIVLGGLDNPIKIMSGEYDLIVIDEATAIAEDDWEFLLTRLRSGVVPYQQIIACCNPVQPSHWIKQRADLGTLQLLTSKLTDNLLYFDPVKQEWTPEGKAYKEQVLDRLTGVRRMRLLDGLWCAAEGRVYDNWEPSLHVVKLDTKLEFFKGGIFATVDWGLRCPGVIQVWGLDGDGRMYLIHEVYQTEKLVTPWWTDTAKKLSAVFKFNLFICDPEDPEAMEHFRRAGLRVLPAYKSKTIGIQNMKARLDKQADGKPRLFVLDDCLAEIDQKLVTAKKPYCFVQEMDGYVWSDKLTKEEPVKEDDHGCDCARYACAYADKLGVSSLVFPSTKQEK